MNQCAVSETRPFRRRHWRYLMKTIPEVDFYGMSGGVMFQKSFFFFFKLNWIIKLNQILLECRHEAIGWHLNWNHSRPQQKIQCLSVIYEDQSFYWGITLSQDGQPSWFRLGDLPVFFISKILLRVFPIRLLFDWPKHNTGIQRLTNGTLTEGVNSLRNFAHKMGCWTRFDSTVG